MCVKLHRFGTEMDNTKVKLQFLCFQSTKAAMSVYPVYQAHSQGVGEFSGSGSIPNQTETWSCHIFGGIVVVEEYAMSNSYGFSISK